MNLLFLNCTEGFPNGFSANNTKIRLCAEGLISSSITDNITIINKYYGKVPLCKEYTLQNHGGYYVITFENSGNKVLYFLKNTVKLIKYLKDARSDKNVVLFNGGYYPIQVFFNYICHSYNYKTGYIYQEWHRGFKVGVIQKINNYLMDVSFPKRVDFVLPISEFLINKTKALNPSYFKLPILADFSKIAISSFVPFERPYFVYCASVAYRDTLDLVLESMKNALKLNSELRLCLILSGDKNVINDYDNLIRNSNLNEFIIIKHNVSNEDLVSIYKSAIGLLIPLNPNRVTEKARFSQKIAEYLSTKTPIVTTLVGDNIMYFKDKVNAFISEYNPLSISETMCYIATNMEVAAIVGENGFRTGETEFSNMKVMRSLREFLNSLWNEHK